VPITYENWKDVLEDLKEHVWKEMLRRFTYPEHYDKVKCRGHVMVLAGKALQNFRYKLNKEYVQKGENPSPITITSCLKFGNSSSDYRILLRGTNTTTIWA
jgi:hypothetical protein